MRSLKNGLKSLPGMLEINQTKKLLHNNFFTIFFSFLIDYCGFVESETWKGIWSTQFFTWCSNCPIFSIECQKITQRVSFFSIESYLFNARALKSPQKFRTPDCSSANFLGSWYISGLVFKYFFSCLFHIFFLWIQFPFRKILHITTNWPNQLIWLKNFVKVWGLKKDWKIKKK